MTSKTTTYAGLLLMFAVCSMACWCGGEEEKEASTTNAMDTGKLRDAMFSALGGGDFAGARARANQLEAAGGEVSADVRERIERGLEAEKIEWMKALDAELAKGEKADYGAASALARSLEKRGVALGDPRTSQLAALKQVHEEQERARFLIVDLPALAGKSPEQVRAILGKPKSCGKLEVKKNVLLQFDHCVYPLEAPMRLQVDYILGEAAFFEVFGAREDLSPGVLPRLGFKESKPHNQAKSALSWFHYEGFHSLILIQFENMSSLQIQINHIERSRISQDKKYRRRVIRGSKMPR